MEKPQRVESTRQTNPPKQPSTCRAVVQRKNTVEPQQQATELPQSGNLSTRVCQRVVQAPTLGGIPGQGGKRQAETWSKHPAPLNKLNYRDRRAALQKGGPGPVPTAEQGRRLGVGCFAAGTATCMCTLALVLWRGGGREGGVCFSNLVLCFNVQNTKNTTQRLVPSYRQDAHTHIQHIREPFSTAFIINLDWYRGRPI